MKSMALYCIPFQDKFLIYRPLLQLAFPGNRQLADLAEAYCRTQDANVLREYPEVSEFFRRIGFFAQDPQITQFQPDISVFHPVSAALLMTNRCNLRCIYCYANGGEENNFDLPYALGAKAIEIAAQNAQSQGLQEFEVTFHGGGEPTLPWETLNALAAHARRQALPAVLSLVSNGVWSEEHCNCLMEWLDGLTISMDGAAETQNLQRPDAGGQGSFERVMRTIERLSARQFPFNIRVTSTPARFSALPEDVRFFCENTACKTIQVEPAFNHQRGQHSCALREEGARFSQAFLQAFDIAQSTQRELYYSGARPGMLTNEFCTAPLGGSLTVNPLGEITGCYEATGRQGHSGSVFGKLSEEGAEIDEEKRLVFMRGILRRKESCHDCFCYYHCAGDCYTRGLPNPAGPWPYTRCEINREITLGLLLRRIAE